MSGDAGTLNIPNNTPAALAYYHYVHLPESYFYSSQYDWAMEGAKAIAERYERENGHSYFSKTGITTEKIAFEIRIHAETYHLLPVWPFVGHAEAADVSAGESGVFQTAIDFLFFLGCR